LRASCLAHHKLLHFQDNNITWVIVIHSVVSIDRTLGSSKSSSQQNEVYCFLFQFPVSLRFLNPLNAELNPICHLLALLGVHPFLHNSRIRVKSLTLRLLMTYIYIYIYIYIWSTYS
jgi:transposase